MPWLRLDDAMGEHRKTRRLIRKGGLAPFGLHVLGMLHAARYETDGFVDAEFVDELFDMAKIKPRQRQVILAEVVTVGQWEEIDGGWLVHDFLNYNPSSEQTEANREWDRRRKELQRDQALVDAIKRRDGNRCRYCGQQVDWRDRRSALGATYDHVIPRGPNSLDNVVVACRGCNMRKGNRTPEEAGMGLLEPGALGSQVPTRSSPSLDPGQNGTQDVQDPVPSRPVPDQEEPNGSSSEAIKATPEQVRLCHLLADLVVERDPKAKPNPDSAGWLRPMRLLLDDRDNDAAEIERVLRWSQADPFWQTNILSPLKLRKQFTALTIKMKAAPIREAADQRAAPTRWQERSRQWAIEDGDPIPGEERVA